MWTASVLSLSFSVINSQSRQRRRICLAYPQRGADRYEHEPIQLLSLALRTRVQAFLGDAGLAQLAQLYPLLVIEERPRRGNHLPSLAPKARELGQVADVLLDVLSVFEDQADEVHVLLQRRRLHRLAVFRLRLGAGFPEGEQEARIDVGNFHALEVRFEQRPFLVVVAALPFRHLAQLVGVLQEGLRAGGEGAAVQVLAPPRAVAQIEIPIGGDLGGGVQRALAGRFLDQLALQEGSGGDDRSAVAALLVS